MKKMTIFGIGDKVGIPTLIYLGVAYWLTNLYPSIFRFPNWAIIEAVRVPKGLLLIGIGLIILVLSAGHLLYAYFNHKLAKTGFYRLTANPLYANAVLFLIPGVSLFLDSWLMLTASVFLYVLYRHYVSEEYEYLKQTFGKEYEDYYKTIVFKWL